MALLKAQCQSCGMPLDQDPKGGGTEENGTLSKTYCSLCYRDGAFIGPDCTLKQMQTIVDEALKERGSGWLMRKIAVWQIPRLDRWRNR